MMLMMVVFWALVITGLVLGIRWLARQGQQERPDRALDILRERYARGEINQEEFEARRRAWTVVGRETQTGAIGPRPDATFGAARSVRLGPPFSTDGWALGLPSGSTERLHERPRAVRQQAGFVVDHVEVPPEPEPLEAHREEMLRLDLPAHGVHGHEGHTEPRGDRLFDGFGVAELHGNGEPGPRLLEDPLRQLTSRRALLPHEHPFLDQNAGRDFAPTRPAVLGRNDQHQFVQQARRQTFLALPERVTTHDSEIHLVRPDTLLDEG
jgi:putative membrane protein